MSRYMIMIILGLFIPAMACSLKIHPKPDPFYQAILDEKPNHALALFSQAEVYRQQGQFRQARDYYQRCLDQAPTTISAWSGLGYCEMELKQFAKAEEAFQKALALKDSDEIRSGLVTALLLQGKSPMARKENEINQQSYGESATRYRLEGDIEFYENHPQKAYEAYRKSLLMYPRQPKIEQRVQELEDFLTSTP